MVASRSHSSDGETRTFLLDGDTVVISATAPGPNGTVIGFGEVTGTIGAARRLIVGGSGLPLRDRQDHRLIANDQPFE